MAELDLIRFVRQQPKSGAKRLPRRRVAAQLGISEEAVAQFMQAGHGDFQAEKTFGSGYGETAGGLDPATYRRLTYVRVQCMLRQQLL